MVLEKNETGNILGREDILKKRYDVEFGKEADEDTVVQDESESRAGLLGKLNLDSILSNALTQAEDKIENKDWKFWCFNDKNVTEADWPVVKVGIWDLEHEYCYFFLGDCYCFFHSFLFIQKDSFGADVNPNDPAEVCFTFPI
jgi:hypothetical protein